MFAIEPFFFSSPLKIYYLGISPPDNLLPSGRRKSFILLSLGGLSVSSVKRLIFDLGTHLFSNIENLSFDWLDEFARKNSDLLLPCNSSYCFSNEWMLSNNYERLPADESFSWDRAACFSHFFRFLSTDKLLREDLRSKARASVLEDILRVFCCWGCRWWMR